jgi:RND family efflux transporter MFP subunit
MQERGRSVSRTVSGASLVDRHRLKLRAGLALAAATLLAACNDNHYVAPPPPKVTVALPVKQEVTRYLEATGNLAAVNTANLVARVAGFVQEIKYTDGVTVKAGEPLFVIEPGSYENALDQAKAAEAGVDATMVQAQADYSRQVELAGKQFASKATLDSATATRDSALAKQHQAQADTKQAEINLGYTQVKAPFDGIVTARQVSIGELVGMGSPTVLATVVQLDPIYVNFNIGEQDVLRLRAGIRRQGLTEAELRQIPVEVGLGNETGYPHKGLLDYANPGVSPSTGTLTVRGSLPNADRVLLAGYFVRVRVPLAQEPDALLVPDAATGADQGGRYVLVVGKDDVVEQRKVDIGQAVGELRVIVSGLKPDDRVIVSGLARAVPGQKVDAQPQAAEPAAVAPK